jgi:AccI restriction endonuclease
MTYYEKIRELTKNVPTTLVDFDIERDKARTPTQASPNFITNKEQGDWAENLVTRAINDTSIHCVAVKYGKSDDLVAGEVGFDAFYQAFQNELDKIGKRPDLLIFNKKDFDENLGFDISQIPHNQITDYVKKAIAGIEVRSSAFLINQYEASMQERTEFYVDSAMRIKEYILSDFLDVLQHPARESYIELLKGLTEKTLSVTDFRVPSWSSSVKLIEVKDLFRLLKRHIKEIQKRDYLSITPKVEDIKVVYKWIETFNVPHYYFQVFLIRFMVFHLRKFSKLSQIRIMKVLIFQSKRIPKIRIKRPLKSIQNQVFQLLQKWKNPSMKALEKKWIEVACFFM